MWLRWLPWRFIVRHAARTHGFVDPIGLLTQFARFSRPAEVLAPTEILRAGIWLTARGFINSQAIQHNLDWVWPHWVTQQFDPLSPSFIPRAFSMSHINITHRNWTAVGLPGHLEMPLIDPRGMVTPHYDGWSIDAWIIGDNRSTIIPSRMDTVIQTLTCRPNLRVTTTGAKGGATLQSSTEVTLCADQPCCHIDVEATTLENALLVIAVRPFNPEGVSFIHDLSMEPDRSAIVVNKHDKLFFSPIPEEIIFSRYHDGDVFHRVAHGSSVSADHCTCDVGMATAAAVFPLQANVARQIRLAIPLAKIRPKSHQFLKENHEAPPLWDNAFANTCMLDIPDTRMMRLFSTAVSTMILHSPDDVYAGPYIYKRFWFRDAVLIANAMLAAGLTRRVEQIVSRFFARQTVAGYFLSQEGEWDSNGQVLWLLDKLRSVTATPLNKKWYTHIRQAALWILRKSRTKGSDGMMPAGFSAEHFGPNDSYYWDDFWSIAGLRGAVRLMHDIGDTAMERRCAQGADDLTQSVNNSLKRVEAWLKSPLLPTSPNRRMDSAAVGSLAAAYPLQVFAPHDQRIKNTYTFLLENCMINGALFHDISHSGLNPYLTLHLAQALLRAGDSRYYALMDRIAQMASPTGQWPEAIHPALGTGCMGDGEHVWAAAEWFMIVRNCFVREEFEERKLVLCSGLPHQWLSSVAKLSLGPTLTSFGKISVQVTVAADTITVSLDASWNGMPATMVVAIPSYQPVMVEPGQNSVQLSRLTAPSGISL